MTEGEKLLKGIHLTDELFNLYDEMSMQQALDITDQIIVTVFCALNCKKGIDPDDKETIQRTARLFSDHVLFKLTDFNNINWEEDTDAFSNDNCSHANPKNSCGGKADGYSDDDLR